MNWLEGLKLLLNKFDIKLIYALLFTGITLLLLNKIKYPMLFYLPETISGGIKFAVIVIILFAISYLICDSAYRLMNNFRNYIYQREIITQVSENFQKIMNNPEIYWLEGRIIKTFIGHEIQEYDEETLGQIIAEELKEPNTFNPQLNEIISACKNQYGIFSRAIGNLKHMKIIQATSRNHIKINDSLYQELINLKSETSN